ncbi:hypothetical protein AMTRI_Chr13g118570 [Amborella trichopoda]
MFLLGVIISSSKLFFYADTQHQFNALESDWGFTSFMSRNALYDPNKGYLVNDTIVVEAEVVVDWGFTSSMPRSALYDPNKGYLVNDTIAVEAEDAVCRVADYWLCNSKKETVDKHLHPTRPHRTITPVMPTLIVNFTLPSSMWLFLQLCFLQRSFLSFIP